MIIKIQIHKATVLENVKHTTLMKGRFEEAAGQTPKTALRLYSGDDPAQDYFLDNSFNAAIEVLKTILAEHIVPEDNTIGNNVIYNEQNSNDVVEITLDVSRRHNGAFVDTIARLSAKYVEDYILYEWWNSIGNTNMAAPLQASLALDETTIWRAFMLPAPRVPAIPYTSSLSIGIRGEASLTSTSNGLQTTIERNEHNTLTYAIDEGALDDIEARSDNPSVLTICRDVAKCSFCLNTVNTGIALVTVFSRHNDDVKVELLVTVTEEERYDE